MPQDALHHAGLRGRVPRSLCEPARGRAGSETTSKVGPGDERWWYEGSMGRDGTWGGCFSCAVHVEQHFARMRRTRYTRYLPSPVLDGSHGRALQPSDRRHLMSPLAGASRSSFQHSAGKRAIASGATRRRTQISNEIGPARRLHRSLRCWRRSRSHERGVPGVSCCRSNRKRMKLEPNPAAARGASGNPLRPSPTGCQCQESVSSTCSGNSAGFICASLNSDPVPLPSSLSGYLLHVSTG